MFNFFRADSTLQLVGGVSSAKRRNDAARVDPEKQDDEHIPSLADLIVEYVPSLSIDNTSYRPSYTVQKSESLLVYLELPLTLLSVATFRLLWPPCTRKSQCILSGTRLTHSFEISRI